MMNEMTKNIRLWLAGKRFLQCISDAGCLGKYRNKYGIKESQLYIFKSSVPKTLAYVERTAIYQMFTYLKEDLIGEATAIRISGFNKDALIDMGLLEKESNICDVITESLLKEMVTRVYIQTAEMKKFGQLYFRMYLPVGKKLFFNLGQGTTNKWEAIMKDDESIEIYKNGKLWVSELFPMMTAA